VSRSLTSAWQTRFSATCSSSPGFGAKFKFKLKLKGGLNYPVRCNAAPCRFESCRALSYALVAKSVEASRS
jgi:hypothetical protein